MSPPPTTSNTAPTMAARRNSAVRSGRPRHHRAEDRAGQRIGEPRHDRVVDIRSGPQERRQRRIQDGAAERDGAQPRGDEDEHAGEGQPQPARLRSRPQQRDHDQREADHVVEVDRRAQPPRRVRRDLLGGDDARRRAERVGDHASQEVEHVAEDEEPQPPRHQRARARTAGGPERGADQEHEHRRRGGSRGVADRLADRRRPGLRRAPVPQDVDEDHEEDREPGGQVEGPHALASGDAGHRVHRARFASSRRRSHSDRIRRAVDESTARQGYGGGRRCTRAKSGAGRRTPVRTAR